MLKKQTNQNCHVIGVCGSLRPASYSKKALYIALLAAKKLGASTQLIDLRNYDLPFCTGEELNSKTLDQFKSEMHTSTAIIFASPEYHGGYSGVLKNALDLLSSQEFEGKLCGLIGVSEGMNGGINVLISLREVLRSLKAWTLPRQVSISFASKQFDTSGTLINQELATRLSILGEELVHHSLSINNTKTTG